MATAPYRPNPEGSEGSVDAEEISEGAGMATERRWDFHGDKNKALPLFLFPPTACFRLGPDWLSWESRPTTRCHEQ